MAKTSAEKAAASPEYPMTTRAIVVPIVGWLIPGGGHIMQKRYVRGLLLMVSVVAMFLLGLGMNGRVYGPNGGDILEMLGFVGDLGSGVLYFLAMMMGWGQAAAAHATADYGKTFWILAGLLKFIPPPHPS